MELHFQKTCYLSSTSSLRKVPIKAPLTEFKSTWAGLHNKLLYPDPVSFHTRSAIGDQNNRWRNKKIFKTRTTMDALPDIILMVPSTRSIHCYSKPEQQWMLRVEGTIKIMSGRAKRLDTFHGVNRSHYVLTVVTWRFLLSLSTKTWRSIRGEAKLALGNARKVHAHVEFWGTVLRQQYLYLIQIRFGWRRMPRKSILR